MNIEQDYMIHTVSTSVVGGTQLPRPGQRNRRIVFPRSRLYGYSMGQCPLNRLLFLHFPPIEERTHQNLSRTSLLPHFWLFNHASVVSAHADTQRAGLWLARRERERAHSAVFSEG